MSNNNLGIDVGDHFSYVSHNWDHGSTSGCGCTCQYDTVWREYIDEDTGYIVRAETYSTGDVTCGGVPVDYLMALARIRA